MMQNMKPYEWQSATLSRTDYGEDLLSYSPIGTVKMFISFADINQAEQNQVLIDKYSHIGLTREKNIQKHDKIGDYLVQYVLESKPFYRVFLLEVKDGIEG